MGRTSIMLRVRSSGFRAAVALVMVTAGLAASAPWARGDETDQFTLPPDAEFADLGPFFSRVHYEVLEALVAETNEQVRKAQRIGDPEKRRRRIDALHSPKRLAGFVRGRFGPGFFEMRDLESVLRIRKLRDRHPGQVTLYSTPKWIYFYAHLPIDPRRLVLLFQGSTVNLYGTYLGTDKFGHFHDLGHIYHKDYRSLLDHGKSEEEALAIVVKRFSRGPISEGMIIGAWATGVFSNADLASNYLGFKFYLNLTEPVMLEGREYPPLLVRIGDLLALNRHVRPESDFFRPFVSDHLNEALNPSIYEWGMRGPIAKCLRENADDILAVYADENGNPRPREYFVEKAKELSTYYGEDYGFATYSEEKMVTIASCCFPEEDETEMGHSTEAAANRPTATDDVEEGPTRYAREEDNPRRE